MAATPKQIEHVATQMLSVLELVVRYDASIFFAAINASYGWPPDQLRLTDDELLRAYRLALDWDSARFP